MASTFKTVAVIGASGSIGKIILQGLVDSAQFKLTAISRNTSEVAFPPSVAVVKTDYSHDSLVAAFQGQDVVISVVGATAFGEQTKFVDAALSAGVKRFLPSEFSVSSQNPVVLQLLPLFGLKAQLMEYLRSKESEGLTWTGLATSGLLDWGLENGFLEFDLAQRAATVWDGGNKSFTFTNEKQLGQAVVSVLKHPEETKNKYLFVASSETTQNELVAALEDVSGEKWTVTPTSTDEQVAAAFAKLQAGDFSGAFALVRATAFGNTPGIHSNFIKDEKVSNDLLGLKLEDVKDVVKRVLKK